MRLVGNVISLADIRRPGTSTIGWMVTQGLHSLLSTFLHVRCVEVSISDLQPDPLELVSPSVSTISAFQSSLKWLIRLVRRCVHAHDIPGPSADGVPSVRIAIRAERFGLSSMWTSESTKIVRELLLELVPTAGEIRILIKMRPVGYVVSIAPCRLPLDHFCSTKDDHTKVSYPS